MDLFEEVLERWLEMQWHGFEALHRNNLTAETASSFG